MSTNGDTPLLCHLCQEPVGSTYVTTPNGMIWCADLAACKFRAGRRLGLPLHVSLDARARDLHAQARDLDQLATTSREQAEAVRLTPPPTRDPVYVAHINSTVWRSFADEQKLLAGWRCEWPKCRARDPEIEAHHLHYDRFGRERPEDVLCVCPICHRDLDAIRRDSGRVPDVTVTVEGTRRVVDWEGGWVPCRWPFGRKANG